MISATPLIEHKMWAELYAGFFRLEQHQSRSLCKEVATVYRDTTFEAETLDFAQHYIYLKSGECVSSTGFSAISSELL